MEDKCIIGVSYGRRFNKQTDLMIDSFLRHNSGWDAVRYYDKDLGRLLPGECGGWSPFNKCEIGRWYAFKDAAGKYRTVLYADGDVRWYSRYAPVEGASLILTPHCVSAQCKRARAHNQAWHGDANIGIMQINAGDGADMICDFIMRETFEHRQQHMRRDKLWLQSLVSVLGLCGFDTAMNLDPGMNMAKWNTVFPKERGVKYEDGGYVVEYGGGKYPLVSYHFSAPDMGVFDCDPVLKRLKDEYLAGLE